MTRRSHDQTPRHRQNASQSEAAVQALAMLTPPELLVLRDQAERDGDGIQLSRIHEALKRQRNPRPDAPRSAPG